MSTRGAVAVKREEMLFDGAWRGARSGRRFVVHDPATGDELASVPDAGAEDVDAAVDRAVVAARKWSSLELRERIRCLRLAADAIRGHAERLALVDSMGSGNPIASVRREVDQAVAMIDLMCSLALGVRGETIPVSGSALDFTLREPYGVVARIIPFNHPFMFSVTKLVAPLVAGNSVILKPSPYGCLSSLEVARMFDEFLPPGVLSVITDAGSEAGRALVGHPKVKRIAFTGSAGTAQRIMAEGATGGIKHFTFELGGKNPLIVFPDAALADAVEAGVNGMNLTATLGQSCGSTSRAFVHESLYDEFVEAVAERFEALVPGIPTDYDTQIGCLSSEAQFRRVDGYVKGARAEGAKLVTGGAKPGGSLFEAGHFYAPTLFAEVRHGMQISREEVFGPVLSVIRWTDEEQMFEQVNDVDLGLTANILTHDIGTAHRAVRRVEAGYVWVNSLDGRHWPAAPFGGYKNSGVGAEECADEILSYLQTKNVWVPLS